MQTIYVSYIYSYIYSYIISVLSAHHTLRETIILSITLDMCMDVWHNMMADYKQFVALPEGYCGNIKTIEKMANCCSQICAKKQEKYYNYRVWKLLNFCLHDACRVGHYETVELILDKGIKFVDHDYCDYGGYRESLNIMCKKRYNKIIKLVTSTDFYYWNQGLLAASCYINYQMIEYMVSKGADNWGECLENACSQGNARIVKFIIRNSINDMDDAIYNSFCVACFEGNLEILKLLISTGHEFDWNKGLLNACSGGYVEMVEFVISKGGNDWNRGFKGGCCSGNFKTAVLMVNKGADLSLALHEACIMKFVDMVEYILEKSENIICADILNKELHEALTRYFLYETNVLNVKAAIEIAKLLMNKGATITADTVSIVYKRGIKTLIAFAINNSGDSLTKKLLTDVINSCVNSDVDISYVRILLINKGADVLNFDPRLKKDLCNTVSFQLYCWCCKNIDDCVMNKEKYNKILKVYPPYVLLSLSRSNKICTRRLPQEIFRLLFIYLH